MKHGMLLSTFGTALCSLLFAAKVTATQPSYPSPHLVISYLVSAGPDSSALLPMEGAPISAMQPHSWEWRIFDPANGSDRLLHRLRVFPVGIRWDSSFTHVEFILGNKIARAPWAFSGEVQDLTQLPSDSSLCDFWPDPAGGWHVVTQRETARVLPDGRRVDVQVGTRWDLSPGSSAWRVAEVDSEAGGHYGECYVTAKLERGAPRPAVVTANAMLGSMGLDTRRVTAISRNSLGSKSATDLVWVPSEIDTSLGFEMGAGEGDSYHAFEPIVWVDRSSNRRRTVYSIGQSHGQSLGQVGFEERQGKTLIVSEYEGGYPRVVDVRSGRISLKVNRPSARAVWVPAPR